ncbi:MAG: DUF6036 family nucleotidyltransferase [Candidatus Diapherotrites archaeon]
MITSMQPVQELFQELSPRLSTSVRLYLIGGIVLLQQGLKGATKDIDIVVETKEEFEAFHDALEQAKFSPKIPRKGAEHMNLNQVFVRGELNIDLFQKEVCGKFALSKTMMQRARPAFDYPNLGIFFCSNEDIFLFKNMTERDGDIDDCLALANMTLNYDSILEELQHQIKQSKQDIWVTWVGERMDILEEKGAIIPIMDRLNQLREAYMEKWMKEREK